MNGFKVELSIKSAPIGLSERECVLMVNMWSEKGPICKPVPFRLASLEDFSLSEILGLTKPYAILTRIPSQGLLPKFDTWKVAIGIPKVA